MPSSANEKNRLPFDIYDFFGYILPGVYITVSLLIIMYYENCKIFTSAKNILLKNDLNAFLFNSTAVMFAILSVYFVGHVVATFSHIFIDKIIMKGIVGYPVIRLLGYRRRKREYSDATFKYFFILLNLAILIPIYEDNLTKVVNKEKFLFVLMLILIIFRFFISAWRDFKGGKSIIKARKKYRKIYLLSRIIYLYPIYYIFDPIYNAIEKLFGVKSRLNKYFILEYKKIFRTKFNMPSHLVASENYWLPYFYQSDVSPIHASLFRTWLHLYGFARNISAASYMVSYIIIFYLFTGHATNYNYIRIHLCITLFFSWIFGLRYLLIYTNYYTKSILRAFVATDELA